MRAFDLHVVVDARRSSVERACTTLLTGCPSLSNSLSGSLTSERTGALLCPHSDELFLSLFLLCGAHAMLLSVRCGICLRVCVYICAHKQLAIRLSFVPSQILFVRHAKQQQQQKHSMMYGAGGTLCARF